MNIHRKRQLASQAKDLTTKHRLKENTVISNSVKSVDEGMVQINQSRFKVSYSFNELFLSEIYKREPNIKRMEDREPSLLIRYRSNCAAKNRPSNKEYHHFSLFLFTFFWYKSIRPVVYCIITSKNSSFA